MKKLLLLITSLALSILVFAQTPESFKYQAVARDASGSVLANKSVSFRISIQQGTITGPIVYSETHFTTTNEFGLVNLEIGKGTVGTGVFSAISWGTDSYFIKVEMDAAGGTAFQFLGSSQLLSVPYALHAKTVETGDNWGSQATVTDPTLSGNGSTAFPLALAQQAATPGQILQWGASGWAPGNALAPGGSQGHIQFNNSGTFGSDPKLFWDNDLKRLGIGTGNPYGDLDIRGSYHSILNVTAPMDAILRLDRQLANRWATIDFLNNGLDMFWVGLNGNNNFSISRTPGTLDGLEVRENGDLATSDNIFVPTGKSIGVGVTNPLNSLELMGGSTSYAKFFHTTSGTGGDDGLLVGIQQSSNAAWVWNYENGPLSFGTNGLYRMLIKATGETGIGTSDPMAQLHVASNSTTAVPNLLLTENDNDYARLMFKNTATPTRDWTIAGLADATSANSRLNFYYSDGQSGTDVLSITGSGEVNQAKTGDAHLLPVAYGNLKKESTINSGTGNFSCIWNGTLSRYEITITGENFVYYNYTALVTPVSSTAVFAVTGSVDGKLLVHFYTPAGASVQSDFQFVVYKQ